MKPSLRLRFWLRAMDFTNAVFGFGSRPYLWCLRKASDAIDWGDAIKPDAWEPWE